MTDTGARASLQRTLSRAAGRLRTRRLLAALPVATAAALSGPALGLVLPAGPLPVALAILTPTLAAAVLAWRTVRPPSAAQAAAWLDRRAGLADTLTTACWFLDHPGDDIWVLYQRERAAEAGRRLDVRELAPLRVPRGPTLVAAALALVVTVADRDPRPPAATPRAAVGAGAPGTDEAPVESARKDPDDPDAGVGRDRVRDAAPVLEDLEALAEELRRGLSDAAKQRLEELARRAEAARTRGAEPGDGAAETATARTLTGEELAAALAEATQAADPGDDNVPQGAEEAAEAGEGPQEEGAAAPDAARRASADQDTSALASADAGVRWSLDTLDTQAQGAEEAQQAARGDAAGPPAGGDPEAGEATELDVELERESLSSESARETEPTEIAEEASREQSAQVGYRGSGGGRYEAARPQQGARVPWSDRERVRLYLLALAREEAER